MKAWGANEIRDLGSPRPELWIYINIISRLGITIARFKLKGIDGSLASGGTCGLIR